MMPLQTVLWLQGNYLSLIVHSSNREWDTHMDLALEEFPETFARQQNSCIKNKKM